MVLYFLYMDNFKTLFSYVRCPKIFQSWKKSPMLKKLGNLALGLPVKSRCEPSSSFWITDHQLPMSLFTQQEFFLPCYVQWRYIPKEIFKGLSIHENIPMSPVTKSFASKSWKVTLIFIYVLTLGSNLIFQYSNFQNQNSNVNKGNQRWPIFNKHQRFVWVL